MSTILEELLIKVGVVVDDKGIEKAQKKTRDAMGADASADARKTKVSKAKTKEAKAKAEQEKKREVEAKKAQTEEEKRQKGINKELNSAKALLGGVAGGWVVAGAAVGAFVKSQMNAQSGQVKFARSIDISFDKMQQLKAAAAKEDIAAGDVESTLASLTSVIGATNDGFQNMGLALLGISAWASDGSLKDSLELLLEVSEAIKGLPKQVQLQRLGQVGISQSMLPFMQQSRFSIESEMTKAATLSVSSENAARMFEEASTEFSRSVDSWKSIWASGPSEIAANLAKQFGISLSAVPETIREIQMMRSESGRRELLMRTPRGKILRAQDGQVPKMSVIINANGLSEQEAERVATNALTGAIRTSMKNNEQQGDL